MPHTAFFPLRTHNKRFLRRAKSSHSDLTSTDCLVGECKRRLYFFNLFTMRLPLPYITRYSNFVAPFSTKSSSKNTPGGTSNSFTNRFKIETFAKEIMPSIRIESENFLYTQAETKVFPRAIPKACCSRPNAEAAVVELSIKKWSGSCDLNWPFRSSCVTRLKTFGSLSIFKNKVKAV